MKISNLENSNGIKVKNQFVLTTPRSKTFQSYDSVICKINTETKKVVFDKDFLNFSTTTSKHTNKFLKDNGISFTIQDIRKNNKLVTFRKLNK